MTDRIIETVVPCGCNTFVRVACEVCGDLRFVATHADVRRYVGGNSPSHVFPCPVCGEFILDGDGKKYGMPGRRYGNPTLGFEADYFVWRARNAKKAPGWTRLPLFDSELPKERRLHELYPAADRRWTRLWVLGEREVLPELTPDPTENTKGVTP